MDARLDVWTVGGAETVPLKTKRVTVGKSPDNDLLVEDREVSRVHCVFECYRAGWSVRDMSSRNGTYVNRERLTAERPLREGDEIRIGSTLMVFYDGQLRADVSSTRAGEPPPKLTPRERDVLVELCRPLHTGSIFDRVATTGEIARRLFVTEPAVRQHIRSLVRKFGVPGRGDRCRIELANEAVRRGALSLSEIGESDQQG